MEKDYYIFIKTNKTEWYNEHLQTGDKYIAIEIDKDKKEDETYMKLLISTLLKSLK